MKVHNFTAEGTNFSKKNGRSNPEENGSVRGLRNIPLQRKGRNLLHSQEHPKTQFRREQKTLLPISA